jgi:uncharacterized protein with PIN domain
MAQQRFIADVMLGRLARSLRMLGVDVLYSNVAEDGEIVRIAERDQRAILTRDVGLCRRRKTVPCLLIDSDDHQEQLDQVVGMFDLSDFETFSRCLECNTPLENLDREVARSRVPNFVYETHDKFGICRTCNRVYWPGSHLRDMSKRVFTRK